MGLSWRRGLRCRGQRLVGLWMVVLALSGCASLWRAQPSVPASERQVQLENRIDGVLRELQKASQPGLSIAVIKEGQVVYSRSKGLADSNRGEAITGDTAFELASVAKPITALAVMRLVEREQVSLQDSILKWLPELPETWRSITVHHLLSNQSGIPDYMMNVPRSQAGLLDGLDNATVLHRLATQSRLDFPAGLRTAYSSSNFVVLAEIVERASGRRFAQYLHEQIFEPLGMHSSFVFGAEPAAGVAVALNHALYTTTDGITLATVGPTGIFSSTADMVRLVDGLLDGKLVALDTLRVMTTVQSPQPLKPGGAWYGYGWLLPPEGRPMTLFAHNGQKDSFRSILRIDYERNMYFLVLSNGGDASQQVIDAVNRAVIETYP